MSAVLPFFRRRVVALGAITIVFLTILVWLDTGELDKGTPGLHNNNSPASTADRLYPSPSSDVDDPPLPRGRVTLSTMKASCATHASLETAPWRSQRVQSISTSHTKATLQPRLSCYLDNRRFFHEDSEPAPLPHMTGHAFFEPLLSDASFDELLHQEAGLVVQFHPSMAIVLSATWNSVNLYHLLADQLLGLAFTLKQWRSGALLGVPREVLHLVNVSWNKQWGKSDQASCLQFSSAFTSRTRRNQRKWTPSLLLNVTKQSFSSSAKKQMHCYCQSLIWYEDHSLPFASPKNHLNSPLRSLAMHEVKRLVQQLDDETEGRYLPSTTSGSCATTDSPKLLMVNRKKRSIGNPDKIVSAAKEIGFDVTVLDFDLLTPREQYHAARAADVFLSIHGMSLTYAVFMNSADRWSGCRTMIELMHWVNPSYFFYYEDLAAIANISRVRVLPNDVAFGPAVVNKKKERVLLKKNVFWWGLKGFDDQTAFYDLDAIKAALSTALANFRSCCK